MFVCHGSRITDAGTYYYWRVFVACRQAVTKEHLSFPVWLQAEIGLDSTMVHWYVSDDLYGSKEKMERGKVGTRERKKLGFGDTSVCYLAENRGSAVCAMPGGALQIIDSSGFEFCLTRKVVRSSYVS